MADLETVTIKQLPPLASVPDGAEIALQGTEGPVGRILSSMLMTFKAGGVGSVIRQLTAKLLDLDTNPEDYGAVAGALVSDEIAIANAEAFTRAFADGKIVDGRGRSYRVIGNSVIDASAGVGVGYGPGAGTGKKWQYLGVCYNTHFIGATSYGSPFLGKHKWIWGNRHTGDVRFSTWHTTFKGLSVDLDQGFTAWFGSDFPPDVNNLGCYYNSWGGCEFDKCVVDLRYGPVNENNWKLNRLRSFHVKDTGNSGYTGGFLPSKDFHKNRFEQCDFLTADGQGIIAPNGRECVFVIDANVNVGGLNTIDRPYAEGAVRGWWGRGLEILGVHSSGQPNGISISGPDKNLPGYTARLSGEAGANARDLPDIFSMGQLALGGDWSILGANGVPVCFSSAMGLVVAADADEPTGLGKSAEYTGAGGSTFDVVPHLNSEAMGNQLTYGVIVKPGAGLDWEDILIVAYGPLGEEVYGTANFIEFPVGGYWIAFGKTYGKVRFTSPAAWSAKFSAVSMGRGSCLISPFTQQNGGKALIDLSGGPSVIRDAMNSSGMGRFEFTQSKQMTTAGGNYDFYSVSFGNGQACTIEISYTINGSGGARYYRKHGYLVRDGAGVLTYTDSFAAVAAGGASTLSIVIAGGVATIRSTVPEADAQTGQMSIRLLGGHIGPASVIVL